MSNTQQVQRQAKTPPRSSARNDLDRIETASTPWWANTPSVAMNCLSIAAVPFNFLSRAASTAVDLCFLAVVATVALWWTGHIPQETVVSVLGDVGQRILGILEGSGLL
jgi:hypothetical protein|nr:hypothetical protein [Neorhizobium tomejilense]